jgi:hypothetical protein
MLKKGGLSSMLGGGDGTNRNMLEILSYIQEKALVTKHGDGSV